MQQKSEEEPTFNQFLKSAPQSLTQCLEQNLHYRLTSPTDTQKFYPTEQQIHSILTTFQQKLQLTQQPAYAVISSIIQSKILIPLLKTLQHPNIDISICDVSCLFSLIVQMSQDIEQAENAEKQEEANGEHEGEAAKGFKLFFRMVVWLVENGVVESLFKILTGLNEQNIEQYDAVRKIFKIYEILIQLTSATSKTLLSYTTIISFLSNRIMPNFRVSHRIIDDNKFTSSDLLLSLLQSPSPSPQQPSQSPYQSSIIQFYKCYGIQILIQTISSYENKLPTQLDQRQYLSNLFDCLNIMLINKVETRKQFQQMKGCYLMVSYVCNKSQYATAALRAISNSLDFQEEGEGERAVRVCEEIVNDGSLKYLFPILMMQGLKGKDEQQQGSINQHILKILYYLLRYSHGVFKDRILYKYTQKRHQKLQRIFQLLVQYQPSNPQQITPQQYLHLIKDQNLTCAQLCIKIITILWTICDKKTKQRIKSLLTLYSIKSGTFKGILELHYRFIDEGKEKQYVERMLAGGVREIEQINQG